VLNNRIPEEEEIQNRSGDMVTPLSRTELDMINLHTKFEVSKSTRY